MGWYEHIHEPYADPTKADIASDRNWKPGTAIRRSQLTSESYRWSLLLPISTLDHIKKVWHSETQTSRLNNNNEKRPKHDHLESPTLPFDEFFPAPHTPARRPVRITKVTKRERRQAEITA